MVMADMNWCIPWPFTIAPWTIRSTSSEMHSIISTILNSLLMNFLTMTYEQHLIVMSSIRMDSKHSYNVVPMGSSSEKLKHRYIIVEKHITNWQNWNPKYIFECLHSENSNRMALSLCIDEKIDRSILHLLIIKLIIALPSTNNSISTYIKLIFKYF